MTQQAFSGVTLARILRPWGRRGEVAAEILTDFPARLASLREVWLAGDDRPPCPVAVRSCRIHLGQAIFHFEGSDSISDAERLRGLEVQVPLSQRMALPAGRFYLSDLAGCAVWEPGATAPLGAVREVQNQAEPGAPESWVLAVDTPAGELLIPLAAEICTAIDTAARRIEVRLPEGLRDLGSAEQPPDKGGPG